jgi:hypothetical protein
MELNKILNEIKELIDIRFKEQTGRDINLNVKFGSEHLDYAKQLIAFGETDRLVIMTAMFFPMREDFSYPIIKKYNETFCLENKFYEFATSVLDGLHPHKSELPNNIVSAKILSNFWFLNLKNEYTNELKGIYQKINKELKSRSNSDKIIKNIYFAYNEELNKNKKMIDDLKIELDELVKKRSSTYNSELEDKITMKQLQINYAKGQ